MTLARALAEKRLVVMLGTGGVGKTTVSAAAALHAARTRRTLVLTIDPARRLADSLGIKLGSEVVNVAPNLDALMLDTKAALDALVTRYAPNSETLSRILRSRFYEQLSDAFAGSEEFVAMGTLHDLVSDGDYDLIVVDTPPSRHAIEFLRTNEKLIRVYESGVVKYLFRPTRILRLGGGYLANVLAKWTSSEYLEEVAEFMVTFDQMFQDMETRVRRIDDVLRDPSRTSLHLVAAAEEESIPQTTRFYKEVRALGLPIDSCVVNRFVPRLPGEGIPTVFGDVEAVSAVSGASKENAAAFLQDAVSATHLHRLIAADHARYAKQLERVLPVPFSYVPALPGSVHDLAGLERVRAALLGE